MSTIKWASFCIGRRAGAGCSSVVQIMTGLPEFAPGGPGGGGI